ncbi:MAG: hypothetical protein ACJ8CR_36285 [Roseiflexaceae bacterium]
MAPLSTATIPTLSDFLVAPVEQVAAVAPATLLLDLRDATLATADGGAPDAEQHARILAGIEALFHLGVRDIVTCVARARVGTGQHSDQRFLTWAERGMLGLAALSAYERCGCRVRVVGVEDMPEPRTAAERWPTPPPADGMRTLWWSVMPDTDVLWPMIAAAARRVPDTTQAGFIRALYGEDIPPATMLLGFGPPLAPEFISLLLAGEMQCYWSQRPVFALDEPTLRRIFYDYAYVRPTRTAGDRSWRYTLLEQQRAAWETDTVLGIGQLGEPQPHPSDSD